MVRGPFASGRQRRVERRVERRVGLRVGLRVVVHVVVAVDVAVDVAVVVVAASRCVRRGSAAADASAACRCGRKANNCTTPRRWPRLEKKIKNSVKTLNHIQPYSGTTKKKTGKIQ